MSRATEAAEIYHYGVLLTVVGARLKRKVWFEYGRPLFPNLYTCLVGPSGLARKTTAIRLGTPLLDDIPVLNGLSTAEGLLQRMTQTPEVLVVFEELASLYQKAKKQEKSAALIPMLAKLYDCPAREDLLTKSNPITVKEPVVSILAATTPEWLERSMQLEDVMGGSANRFLFLVGEPSAPNPLPQIPDMEGFYQRVDKRIAQASGKLVMSEDAEELWRGYYQETLGRKQDTMRATLAIRVPDMALKVAIIVHVLEGTGSVILPETLQAAIDFMEYAQDGIDLVRPLFSSLEVKLMQVLSKGAMSRARLHEKIGGRTSGKELMNALETLIKFRRVGQDDKGMLFLLEVK